MIKVAQAGDVFLTKEYFPDTASLKDIFSDDPMHRRPGTFTANMNEGILFTRDDEGLIYELSYIGTSSVHAL